MPANLSANPPTDLNAVERELKAAYVRHRRVTNRKYALRGPLPYSVCWSAAASLVISLGADPQKFVEAVFVLWPKLRPPQPTDLCNSYAAHLNQMWNGEHGSHAVVTFQGNAGKLSEMVARLNIDPGETVCDPYHDFSAVFRIARCNDGRLNEMLARHGAAVREQLTRDRPLLRFLRQRYPSRAAILLDGPDGPDATTGQGDEEQSDHSAPPSAVATR